VVAAAFRAIDHGTGAGMTVPPSFELTDIGNAERMIHLHGADIRHCASLKWLAWDGRRWAIDETGSVDMFAKATARTMKHQAAKMHDGDIGKKLYDHAHATEANGKIRAMLERASKEPGVQIRVDQLDAQPWLLN